MSAANPRILKSDLLLVLVMSAFVAVPLIGAGWLGSRSDVSATEKRQLANIPHVPKTFGDWKRFPKAFDAFATDRFGFRPELLDGYKRIVAGVFHDSVSSEAFVGRHGWLYITNSNALADMRGADPYTDAALINAVQQINARGELLAVRRIPFSFVVFPDKHTVYPQFLPRGLYAGFDHRRLNALDAAMADTGHRYYFDASDALRADAVDSPFRLYYKSDTHWNVWGGYRGYRAWLAADGARLDFKPLAYTFDQFRDPHRLATAGDLHLMSGYVTRDPDIWPPADAGCGNLAEWKVPRATRWKLHTPASHLNIAHCDGHGNALVIHDSFMHAITRYVTASYHRTWLVWAYPEDAAFGWLVDQLHPDVVIVERVERLAASFPPTDIAALVKDLGVIGQPAVVDAEGRLRLGTEAAAFPRPAVPVTVAMDQVQRKGDQIRLAGWARIGDRSPAAIIVVAGGKVVAEAPVTQHRTDVAKVQGVPTLAWSGFAVDVPAAALHGAGEMPQIYFVDFDDYGAYRMSDAFIQRLQAAAGASK